MMDKKVSYYEEILSNNRAVLQFILSNPERERIKEGSLFHVSIFLMQVR